MMDGCSFWFDGNWRHCCDIHDIAYLDKTGKFAADFDLMQCVAAAGHPIIGAIMFVALTFSALAWYFYKRK